MKSFILFSLMLIPSVVSAEPYKRPLDLDNPYYPPSAYYMEGYDNNPLYLQARRQVAEVCQNLRLYLKKHSNSDMEMYISECNVDDMEWYALEACEKNQVAFDQCPVAELMLLDVGVLRAYLSK